MFNILISAFSWPIADTSCRMAKMLELSFSKAKLQQPFALRLIPTDIVVGSELHDAQSARSVRPTDECSAIANVRDVETIIANQNNDGRTPARYFRVDVLQALIRIGKTKRSLVVCEALQIRVKRAIQKLL